ncbi:MAG: 4a-hydroxytetrahydrobiopterin dehydratase [Nanoarchaeota archaeon]
MLTLGEINEAMSDLDDWSLETSSIVKTFSFSNFKEALEFVNKVGEVAEKIEHHPDVMINFNQVRLSLMTHSENSLTRKDFKLAKEVDKIENVN